MNYLRVILFSVGISAFGLLASRAAPASNKGACERELENANRSIAIWGENMENMVNESKLPASSREIIHNEANQVLDMIEEFGRQVKRKNPIQLGKDLVDIRRRANRMALDVYLTTFDMRWPQNSLQLGVTVERVQQACLDRTTIQALETPPNPLNPLQVEKL